MSGDTLRLIQDMDPDGGPTQPTQADYARFESWVRTLFGDRAWSDYSRKDQNILYRPYENDEGLTGAYEARD